MSSLTRPIETGFLRSTSKAKTGPNIDPKFAKMTHDELATELIKYEATISNDDLRLIFDNIKYEGFNLDEVMMVWLSFLEKVDVKDRPLMINTVLAMAAASIFKIKPKMKYANNSMISQIVELLSARNLSVSRVAAVMPLHMFRLVNAAMVGGVKVDLPFPDLQPEEQVPGIGALCFQKAWLLKIWEARIRGIGRIQKPQFSSMSKDILMKQAEYFVFEFNSAVIGDLSARKAAVKGLSLATKDIDLVFPLPAVTSSSDELWVTAVNVVKAHFKHDLVW